MGCGKKEIITADNGHYGSLVSPELLIMTFHVEVRDGSNAASENLLLMLLIVGVKSSRRVFTGVSRHKLIET